MLQRGSRVRSKRYGYTGTVDKSLGCEKWLVFADSGKIDHSLPGALPGVPVEANEHDLVPIPLEDIEGLTGENRETRAVMLYLRTETGMYQTLADKLSVRDVESFKEEARRLLRDATEVTEEELQGADWEMIFQVVKDEREAG